MQQPVKQDITRTVWSFILLASVCTQVSATKNNVDIESDMGKRIYGYAQKNPKKSIIVQHDKTGHMLYLKKYDMGGES